MKKEIQSQVTSLFIIIFFVSLSSFTTFVETAPIDGNVKGVVVDSLSGNNIEYATVSLFRQADSVLVGGIITNQQGVFQISKIPAGEYLLKIQFMGFKTVQISKISIHENQKSIDLGKISLTASSISLNEAVVSTERNMIQYKLDKKVINGNSQMASTGGTAVDLLKNTPSVTVDVQENVLLRGKADYQVLINGRPSPLQGSDALKQVPASSIDRIEVITNPSASQDAEGTAGIINIITKKNSNQGLGGFCNVTAGTDRMVEDVNLSYQHKKWNFTLGAKFMDYNVPVFVDETRDFKGIDTANFLTEESVQRHITQSRNITFGADYDLNKSNLFSFALNAGTWLHVHNFDSKYQLQNSLNSQSDYTTSNNDFRIGNQFLTANLNYKHLFQGADHDLTFNLFFSTIDGSRYVDATSQFSNASWESINPFYLVDANETSNSTDLRFKVDYRRPVFKTSALETGIQVQLKPYTANMLYNTYSISNPTWFTDSIYTNNIIFNTALYAGYFTFSGAIKNIEYKAGLRGEYYMRDFEYKNSNIQYKYTHFDLFPTLHLSYNLNKENQFQLSYSRRVNRPTAWIMYPVPDFTDNFITSAGNPDLKPEYTNSYEFNYIRQFSKWTLSSEAYHRDAQGSFVQRIIADENGRLYQKTVNFGREIASGIEISANADLLSWLSANIGGSFYHYQLDVNYENNQSTKESYVSNVRLNSSILFSKTAKLQLSFSYDSPVNYVQGVFHERFNTSISFRKDFPKQKCSVTLVARNPISGVLNRMEVKGAQFVLNSREAMDPSYSITISYKFNNFKKQRNVGETNGVGEGVS